MNRFRLEQVLNYRREMEKLRKGEFASAKREFEHALDHLKSEEDGVREVSSRFENSQGTFNSIDDLKIYADYFARKRADIRNSRENVEILDGVVLECRERLVDATKDKKVLEMLKQKKRNEFIRDMAAREMAFLDELSLRPKGKHA